MSEQIVGRIRKDGGWDQRFRPVWRQAEPYRETWRDHLRDVAAILLPLAVIAVWFVALFWALPVLFTVWAS